MANVLFGIAFWGNIHSLGYFIVVQVRALRAYVAVIYECMYM